MEERKAPQQMLNREEQAVVDREIIAQYEELKITTQTQGWKKVVRPLLDKMISDVIGTKQESGSYDTGVYGLDKTDQELARAFHYRQALMEFANHLHSYEILAKRAKARLDIPEAIESPQDYVMPMHDTRYGKKEKETELEVIREGY